MLTAAAVLLLKMIKRSKRFAATITTLCSSNKKPSYR